jgi:hypothetical protein
VRPSASRLSLSAAPQPELRRGFAASRTPCHQSIRLWPAVSGSFDNFFSRFDNSPLGWRDSFVAVVVGQVDVIGSRRPDQSCETPVAPSERFAPGWSRSRTWSGNGLGRRVIGSVPGSRLVRRNRPSSITPGWATRKLHLQALAPARGLDGKTLSGEYSPLHQQLCKLPRYGVRVLDADLNEAARAADATRACCPPGCPNQAIVGS